MSPPPLPAHKPQLDIFKNISRTQLELLLALPKPQFIEFLQSCGLLPSSALCRTCQGTTRKIVDRTNWAGYAFECRTCSRRQSSNYGTFFARAHVSPTEFLRFLYEWSWDVATITRIQHELRRPDGSTLGRATITDWARYDLEREISVFPF